MSTSGMNISPLLKSWPTTVHAGQQALVQDLMRRSQGGQAFGGQALDALHVAVDDQVRQCLVLI